MGSKTATNLARIVSVFLLVHISMCSPIAQEQSAGCQADDSNPESLLYTLVFSEEYSNVTVQYRHCSDLNTVGPSWYRLEVTNSEATQVTFIGPEKRSTGAVLKDNGIEFTASDDQPLVLLDLPRTFKFATESPLRDICFRLTIKHEGNCEQVVSNCTYVESSEESSGHKPITKPLQILYTIVTPVPNKDHCYVQHNCSGKVKRPNKVCGTDGNYYSHVCELRLHRCINDLDYLQRDRTNISCTTVTTAPPPTSPPCIKFIEDYDSSFIPKCDQNGFYKPVQCRRNDEGKLTCFCYDKKGNVYRDPWEVQDCNNTSNFSLPQSHCGI